MTDKAQARAAAERIEKGLELYASGDLAGSRREFEEAIKLDPAQRRAAECLGWVRDLLDGKRSLHPSKALDEDALRAVDDALEDEPPARAPAPAKRTGAASDREASNELPTRPGLPLPLSVLEPLPPAAPEANLDSQWDPVPLTPTPPPRRSEVVSSAPPPEPSGTTTLDGVAPPVFTLPANAPALTPPANAPPTTSPTANAPNANAPTASAANANAANPNAADPNAANASAPNANAPNSNAANSNVPGAETESRRRQSSSTLLGIPPAQFERSPRLSPTPRPMPATDEPPESVTREWHSIPTGSNLPPLDVPELTEEQVQELLALDNPLLAGSQRTTTIDPLPDLDLESERDAGDEPPRLLEFEAEPTPHPHLSPLPRERTSPDLTMPLPSNDTGEFDGFDQTPTRDRSSQLRALGHAPTLAGTEAPDLMPVDSLADETSDSGRQRTNPFVQSRLAEYAPRELPPPPHDQAGGAAQPTVPPGVGEVVEALGRGDASRALELSERLVAQSGGLDDEACKPFHTLLEHVYKAAIGGLDRRPRHGQVTPDLDPRSAFLLSRLDGSLTIEDLLDVSGMPRLEATRILALMIARGVVLLP
ncbi:MAG TPA: hypothetical protein VFF06_30685 [Polyangia bacterium]|nr:hypothetical protein [Polyangia bacterium]